MKHIYVLKLVKILFLPTLLPTPFLGTQDVRAKMREMGRLSGVPIEPVEQTKLLDTCVSLAGVIGGGVPGGKLAPTVSPMIPADHNCSGGL